MFLFILILTICTLQTNVFGASYSDCSIYFPKVNDSEQPILLTNGRSGYELAIPQRGEISLKNGNLLYLFCPPNGNSLQQSNRNLTEATCNGGENLSVMNRRYTFDQLRCSWEPKGTIKTTNSKCGNNTGKLTNIGFKAARDWITLIKICYDDSKGNPLYAEHILHGQTIHSASRQSRRLDFDEIGVSTGMTPKADFKQTAQKSTFTQLLGSASLAGKYIYRNSFLARGHLAPDADFIFAGLQYTTYFYMNVCPQWQSINAGNWLRIENMARKAAGVYQRSFTVITGTHDILTLPNIYNQTVSIFLDSKRKLPIPKFLWKILYLESSKEAVAFVAVNNPHLRGISPDEILCPDICNAYRWSSTTWKNVTKGFVYCCDVRALQRAVKTIPKLNIRGILTNRG